MAEFSVSLWTTIEADSYEEAHEIAGEIEKTLLDYGDSGIIDVECTDSEGLEEE